MNLLYNNEILEKRRKRLKRKKLTYKVILILMGLYFSLLEVLIPKPFPWMKLGLSNIATVIAMEKFGARFGIEILIYRILIYSFIMGTFFSPGFFISIISGILAVLLMSLLFVFRKYLSLPVISMACGAFHNMCQLVVVYFLFFRNVNLFSKPVLIFILIFFIFGTVSGWIVGYVATKFKVKPVKKLYQYKKVFQK